MMKWYNAQRSKTQLRQAIIKKSRFIPIITLKVYSQWEITEQQYRHPLGMDKYRYDSLKKLGSENWLPIILNEDNYIIDGYHRYAVAIFDLHLKMIRIIYRKDLTAEEFRFILDGSAS